MQIDEGLDTGPAAARARARRSGPTRRRPSSSRASPASARELLVETLARPRARHARCRRRRTPARATHAPILKKEDGRVDWSPRARRSPAARAASTPGPAPSPHHEGRLLKLLRVREAPRTPTPARAGPVLAVVGRRRRSSPAAAARACGSTRSSPRAAAPCPPRPGRRARACARARGSAERGRPRRARVALDVLRRVSRRRRATARRRARAPAADAPRRRARPRACSTSSCSARCGGAAGSTTCSAGSASRPLDRSRPAVRDALRLGAYQLLFLRVPAHAAVSESVELAREVEPRAAGFVNAVLRRLQREGPPPEPDPARDPVAWLTIGGLAPALAGRALARPARAGGAAVARARAALDAPPDVRAAQPARRRRARRARRGRRRARPDGASPGPSAPTGAPRPARRARASSTCRTRARSSWRAWPRPRACVLDACAAPGGKALLMADLGGPGRGWSPPRRRRGGSRRSPPRARAGAPERLRLLAADALRPPFRARFDGVLLDAPCSGLGTLARNPDIRWRLAPGDLARHAARQRALLESLAPLVRAGRAPRLRDLLARARGDRRRRRRRSWRRTRRSLEEPARRGRGPSRDGELASVSTPRAPTRQATASSPPGSAGPG